MKKITFLVAAFSMAIMTVKGHATPESYNHNLLELRTSITQFEIQKKKLLEEIAYNTVLALQLERDVEFIEDYAQGRLELDTLVAEHPVVTNGAFVAAVYTGAKFFNQKVIDPALLKQEAGLITKIIQKFPKLSKSAAWMTGIISSAAAIYYSVDRVLAYTDLRMKTSDEVQTLYDQKLKELHMRQDAVIKATRQLLGVNHDLNVLKELEMKSALNNLD